MAVLTAAINFDGDFNAYAEKVYEVFKSTMQQVAWRFYMSCDPRDIISYLDEHFVKILQGYDPTKSKLGAYLYHACYRHAYNYLKSREVSFSKRAVYVHSETERVDDDGNLCEYSFDDLITEYAVNDTRYNSGGVYSVNYRSDRHAEMRLLLSEVLLYIDKHASDVQKNIVAVMAQHAGDINGNQIAKALGLHPQKVARELKKLANMLKEAGFSLYDV